jgi:protein phosphatase
MLTSTPAPENAAFRSDEHNSPKPYLSQLVDSQLEIAAMTHRGGRKENQDRYLVDTEHDLLMVADGVGGLRQGGLAAELACQSIQADVAQGLSLDRAVSRSSSAIAKEANLRGVIGGMGSTVVAVAWSGPRFRLVWVGDSSARGYWADCCYRLTRDHTEAAEWVTHGIQTEASALQPRKHVLTQALGITAAGELRPGRNEGVLRQGEWLMLASDGVTNALTADEIVAALSDAPSAETAAETLMQRTLHSQPTDNATFIIARWHGSGAEAVDLPRVYPE